VLARVSAGLKDAMPGLEISAIGEAELLQGRGW
jgi:pyridoxal biosynthesis lyase PdxS